MPSVVSVQRYRSAARAAGSRLPELLAALG